MVRTYERLTLPNYSQLVFQEALNEIRDKKSTLSLAATKYNVPKTTLWRHLKNENIIKGRPTSLSQAEEKRIVESLKLLADFGFGVTCEGLKDLVRNFAQASDLKTQFKDNRPGNDWIASFKKRWSNELSLRVAQSLPSNRAQNANKKTIDHFFELLERKLKELDILNQPMHIWNADEFGLQSSVGSQEVFCKRGTKSLHKIVGNNEKTSYSVLSCVNACGIFIPPYTVYKATNLYDQWMLGGPPDAMYNTSPSGWMEEAQFYQWFEQLFLSTTKRYPGKHLLIFDGHGSHLSVRTIELAVANNITILCLPSHTTHIIQPLDVSVFKSVKTTWRKILVDYFKETNFDNVSKDKFPSLLRKLHEKSFTRISAINGFEESGIFPFNRDKIDSLKLAPSTAFESNETDINEQDTAKNTISNNKRVHKKANEKQVENIDASLKIAISQILKTKNSPQTRKRKLERPFAEALTEKDVLDKMKKKEDATKEKKIKKNKKQNTNQKNAKASDDSDIEKNDAENNLKCFKCKLRFEDDISNQSKWLSCESCANWSCHKCSKIICKNFKKGETEFFCSKKCNV